MTDPLDLRYLRDILAHIDSGGGPWDWIQDEVEALRRVVALVEPTHNAVLAEVHQERTYQHSKWGQQDHSPAHWHLILAEEVGEVAKALTKAEVDDGEALAGTRRELLVDARDELIQVAAVAVAMVESLDRNELAEEAS